MPKPQPKRRLPWSVGLATVFVGAAVSAETLTTSLELRLQADITDSILSMAHAPSVAPPRPEAAPPLQSFLDRNLFGAQSINKLVRPPLKAPARKAACSPSALPFRLLATLVTDPEGESRAVLEHRTTETIFQHKIRDRLPPDVTITRIEPGTLWLEHQGRCEKITLAPPAPARTPVAGTVHQTTPELGRGIRKSAPRTFQIPREEFHHAIARLPELMRGIRVVPYLEGNRMRGIRIASLRQGHILKKLGIQKGDVLKRVNGLEISGPEQGLEIFQALKNRNAFSLDLTRKDRPQTLQYTVR